MNVRISERDLILPSLYLMRAHGGTIAVTNLIAELRKLMNPPAEDMELLENRNDDKFSQKVRNLKSHNTLAGMGYATHANRSFTITEQGEQYLDENIEVSLFSLNNEFSFSEKEDVLLKARRSVLGNKLELFDENIPVEEGLRTKQERLVYTRSKQLRDFALNYFSGLGPLSCRCCGFVFEQKYGAYGSGYIEIHHIKPISKFSNDEIGQTIEQALVNLVPLCSNCHRMIHRNWAKPLAVEELIRVIENQNHAE